MVPFKKYPHHNHTAFKEKNVLLMGIFLIIFSLGIIFLHPFQKSTHTKNLAQQEKNTENYPFISPQKVFQSIQSHQKENNFILIDIRSSKDYYQEHILDSINISPEKFLQQISLDNKNVIITNFGKVSEFSELWKKLDTNTKQSINILEGGLANWIKNGYPVVALGDIQSFVDQSKVQQIDLEQLKKKINSLNKFTTIIDIRTPKKFRKSHLQQAKNIPFYDLERRRKEIPLENFIILYGDTGLQSFQYGVMMYDMGFNMITIIQNDFVDVEWKEKGLNIVSDN